MISLAADIGGTYSRLAWHDRARPGTVDEQSFNNADFASLEAVIAEGLVRHGTPGAAVGRMVLAVPGPVANDPVILTNIDWQVDRESLRQRFGIAQLLLVNDFQAAALGAIAEPYERLKVLHVATPSDGPVVIAGAGTGLGMAWMPGAEYDGLPRATEGGHIDFAPNSGRQAALYDWLAERYGHVSYERVVSGDGLLDTYRFIAGAGAPAGSPQQIAAAARQGDRHAREAIEILVEVFAAYAGNLALAFTPTAGIFLCGGLAVHLADWFEPTAFTIAYAAKGRMADVVRRIPVFLVMRHNTGLRGANMILNRFSAGKKHDFE